MVVNHSKTIHKKTFSKKSENITKLFLNNFRFLEISNVLIRLQRYGFKLFDNGSLRAYKPYKFWSWKLKDRSVKEEFNSIKILSWEMFPRLLTQRREGNHISFSSEPQMTSQDQHHDMALTNFSVCWICDIMWGSERI